MVDLEGKALNLFQLSETCNLNPMWEAFKVAVVRRFQPTMLKNPFEILIGLTQSGTVEEYIEQFEQYVGFLKGIRQDYLTDTFLNGLKDKIRVEVKLYEMGLDFFVFIFLSTWFLFQRTRDSWLQSTVQLSKLITPILL